MAVTVLLGKAGSGKSTQCYREIQACAAAGGKALLLVPDQATYGAERHLAESSDGQGFLGTQVVGFSRLAYKVFQERGLEHASLSELARKIILQRLCGCRWQGPAPCPGPGDIWCRTPSRRKFRWTGLFRDAGRRLFPAGL